MRHRKVKKILGRKRGPRIALLRTLAIHLISHGRIRTTTAKAKALRPFIERLVTRSRGQKLSDQRKLQRLLANNRAIRKLITEIGPRYRTRTGGYTRIIKLSTRKGDASPTAHVEFV